MTAGMKVMISTAAAGGDQPAGYDIQLIPFLFINSGDDLQGFDPHLEVHGNLGNLLDG